MAYAILNSPSSPTSGMGANLLAGGAAFSFRVWAPNVSSAILLVRPDATSAYQTFNLAPDDATLNYWSADVSGVASGHQYRFQLTNDPTRGPNNPGGVVEHVDPRARQVDSSDLTSPGYVLDPSYGFAPFTPPASQNYVIYQLHIGSFRGKNDSIQVQSGAAQFTDVIPKLGYIQAMGFNAIQFLPAGEFPTDTNEGYAPSNFFAPESNDGLAAGLRQLVDAAHQAGLAVFFDVIYNHVPDQNDNLWRFDGNQSNNDGGGIYIANAPATPWGQCLDTSIQTIHDYFLDNLRMWLGEYNADGIRFDSLHNVYTPGGALWLVQCAATDLPGKMLIAEYDNPAYALANFPLEAVWDMSSADNFRDNVLATGSLDNLQNAISYWGAPHAANLVRYLLGSHDQTFNQYYSSQGGWKCGLCRYFVERVGGIFIGREDWTAQAKGRLGWALNVTMPCTPMLFMGSEVHHYGYWGASQDDYGDHRFDWSLTSDAIGSQMISLVSNANRVRLNHPALSTDTLTFIHFDTTNGVLAFKRWNDGGDIVVTVVNIGQNQFNDATYGVVMGGENGTWEEIFNSQSPQFGGWADSGNYLAYPSVQGDGKIYIRLPKLAVLVFRKT